MEFDLKEVASTILIGAYLIFGLELLFYIFLQRSIYLHLLSFLQGRNLSPHLLIVLAIASTFAFGMLIEALSDKLVDEDTFLQRNIIGVIPESQTDDEIKEVSLLGKENVRSFAIEAARRDLLQQYGGEHGGELQRMLLCGRKLQDINSELKRSVALRFYYHAKNVVYEKDTYYDELKKIQMRIDFARSYLTISFIVIPITLLLFLYSEFIRRRILRKLRRKPRDIDTPLSNKKNFQKRIKLKVRREAKLRRRRFSFILMFLLLSFLVGVYAYNVEEDNFDKRALGYFSSMKADGAKEVKCE